MKPILILAALTLSSILLLAAEAPGIDAYTGLLERASGGYDVKVDGETVAYCAETPCPFDFAAAAGGNDAVDVYVFETTFPGYVVRSQARSDGVCPFDCNSTVRVRIPTRGIDDTYRAATSIRSTGQLGLDIVPVE